MGDGILTDDGNDDGILVHRNADDGILVHPNADDGILVHRNADDGILVHRNGDGILIRMADDDAGVVDAAKWILKHAANNSGYWIIRNVTVEEPEGWTGQFQSAGFEVEYVKDPDLKIPANSSILIVQAIDSGYWGYPPMIDDVKSVSKQNKNTSGGVPFQSYLFGNVPQARGKDGPYPFSYNDAPTTAWRKLTWHISAVAILRCVTNGVTTDLYLGAVNFDFVQTTTHGVIKRTVTKPAGATEYPGGWQAPSTEFDRTWVEALKAWISQAGSNLKQ